jgi:hypothetical protein
MEANKNNRSIVEGLRHIGKEKNKNLFLKIYAQMRGKNKDWSDVRAETLPIDKREQS